MFGAIYFGSKTRNEGGCGKTGLGRATIGVQKMNESDIKSAVLNLAYRGDWNELLRLLEQYPEHINEASYPKGYTPLHQAAWHGAELPVIGVLLRLGACPQAKTITKGQTPREISTENHPNREDMHFLLDDQGRNLSQLIRKIASEKPDLFGLYDGNCVIFDRMAVCLMGCYCKDLESAWNRIHSAYMALTGEDAKINKEIDISIGKLLSLKASSEFWPSTFYQALKRCYEAGRFVPIEKHWAVVADLFIENQETWGLRGDPFLYMEMRQALAQVPLPNDAEELDRLLYLLFESLTGVSPHSAGDIFIERFSRGGMSSGYVCGEYWREKCIPGLKKRLLWLRKSWGDD